MGKISRFQKRFLWGCIFALLTGCGVAEPPTETTIPGIETDSEADGRADYITVAEAKAAVLENAGISEGNARFVRIHLDSDSGASRYEVEFLCEDAEYDYVVNALTGEILSMNCETGQYDIAAVPPQVMQEAGSQTAASQPADALPADRQPSDAQYYQHGEGAASNTEEQITEEQAKQIALGYAGIAEEDAQYLKVEFDYDDGRAEYEVEWHVGRIEYSCDVDACTGEVLSFEKEFD